MHQDQRGVCGWVVGLAGAACVLAGGTLASAQLRTITLSGDAAPSSTGIATFRLTGSAIPVISSSGEIAFRTSVNESGGGWSGVFVDRAGVKRVAAREGFATPGITGATFGNFGNLAGVFLSDVGDTGLPPGRVSFIHNTATGQTGIWTEQGGGLALVATDGSSASGAPVGTFNGIATTANPLFSALNGRTGFRSGCQVLPTGSYDAVWTALPSGNTMVARSPLTVNDPGYTGLSNPCIDDHGQVAFLGTFRDASMSNRGGIFRGPPGGTLPVASLGAICPGLPSGTQFASFTSTTIAFNNVHDVCFSASITGGGTTSANDWTLWGSTPFGAFLAAREGQAFGPGVALGDNSANDVGLVLSDSGHIACIATLSGLNTNGTNNRAVFRRDPGSGGTLRMIARLGTPQAGLEPGETITSMQSPLAMNRAGQLAFLANMQSGTGQNSSALLGTDLAGRLVVILRTGPTYVLRPGLSARFTGFSVPTRSGGSDGQRRSLSDQGELVFQGGWTQVGGAQSGSGIFAISVPCATGGFGTAPCCDTIDFNNDTLFPDSADLDDFVAVLAGGPGACSNAPLCNDIDFNNDGFFPDSADLDAVLSRLAGGPCL
jgi:hypothetical protein